MEDVTRENGTLVIYPGTHKGKFLDHGYPEWSKEGGVNKFYWGIKEIPDENAKKMHVEMKSGDVVLFHPLLIHGSGENRTDGFRKSISCHFASSHCKYIDTKGTLHEELIGEMMSVYK